MTKKHYIILKTISLIYLPLIEEEEEESLKKKKKIEEEEY
jgi:hypothetical protein